MRVLVFQHSEIDHPGVFRDFMREDGIAWDPIDLHLGETAPALGGYDALIVMGGPQQTDEEGLYPWLGREKATIREALDRDMPLLGVCLGCQLMAVAAGGSVAPMREPEIGVIEFALTHAGAADPLFAGLPDRPLTVQWHLNHVTGLPAGAVRLARSEACANQAFRIGSRAYGLQFHMELTGALVDSTRLFPEYVAALEAQRGAGAFEDLVAATTRHEETLRRQARRLFDNWLASAAPSGKAKRAAVR